MSRGPDRIPPHNTDAEASILGGLLLRNEALAQLDALSAEDFYDPRHREVFTAIRTLAARNQPIDPVTLEDELGRAGRLAAVGGLSFFNELVSAVPTADNIGHYSEMVRDLAARRALIKCLSEAAAAAFADTRSVANMVAATRDSMEAITTPKAAGMQPLRAMMGEAIRRMIARADGVERPLMTPWPALNAALGGGLWPGLHVLVGNTGSAKTQLAMQIALEVATAGAPVLYIGLELGPVDLIARLVGLRSHRRWSRLFLGQDQDAASLLFDHAEPLAALPFHLEIAPPFGWNYSGFYESAARLRRLFPEGVDGEGKRIAGSRPMLVVLDFLQLVSGVDTREQLRERIGRASYEARRIARDLDAAVLLVSSTGRDNYGVLSPDENAAPDQLGEPASLVGLGKESGEIEYSADSVLVLQRETWVGEQPASTNVHVAIAKGRALRPGRVTLSFDGGRFAAPTAENISSAGNGRRRV